MAAMPQGRLVGNMKEWISLCSALALVLAISLSVGCKVEKRKDFVEDTEIPHVSVWCLRGYAFAVYDGHHAGGISQILENTKDGLRAMECQNGADEGKGR